MGSSTQGGRYSFTELCRMNYKENIDELFDVV